MSQVATHPIINLLKIPHFWGRSELHATELGDNILECVLLYQTVDYVCNFAAYFNVEYDGTEEEFLAKYGSPANIEQLIRDHGPLGFVPKVHEKYKDLDDDTKPEYAGMHLHHQEDFISPYSDEVNAAISEHAIRLYKGDDLLKQLGMQEPYWTNATRHHQGEPDDDAINQIIGLQPFRISLPQIFSDPVLIQWTHKLREDGSLRATFNIGHNNEFCVNMVEFGFSADLIPNHQERSFKIENLGEIYTLVLVYDDEDRDYHILDDDIWLCDHNDLEPISKIFDMAVLEEQLKQLMLTHPEIQKSLVQKILA